MNNNTITIIKIVEEINGINKTNTVIGKVRVTTMPSKNTKSSTNSNNIKINRDKNIATIINTTEIMIKNSLNNLRGR